MLIIRQDKSVEHVQYTTYSDMKNRIGVKIAESVNLDLDADDEGAKIVLLLDEEGKCKHPTEINLPASWLYRALCGGDYIQGDVALLIETPDKGLKDLSPSHEKALMIFVFGLMANKAESGELGTFEATGPHCEVVSFDSAEEMERYLAGRSGHRAEKLGDIHVVTIKKGE